MLSALLLATSAGCTAPVKVCGPYVIGMSYGVEVAAAQADGDADQVLDRDFASLVKLGFDTVIIRHVEDGERGGVVEAARRCGLGVAVPSRDVLYYVRTGHMPEGCDSVGALVRASWAVGGGGEMPMAVLGEVVDAATASRAREVAAALRKRDDRWSTFARVYCSERADSTVAARPVDAAIEGAPGDLVLLQCRQGVAGSDDRAGWDWLRQYHAGLAAGLTGGVVVDGFRVVPGRWRGLVEGADSVSVRRATAIRRITSRAAVWGPKLRRLRARPIEPVGHSSDRVRAVLFSGSKRRFVLLFNSSQDQFLHRAVQVPGTLDSKPAHRAVFVAPEEHLIAGDVVPARGGRLELPIDLAPGDACLWEIF